MAYITLTIKEAVEHIDCNTYLLPAIQREFVWKTSQIEDLFDSLMRGYPISSFLFWGVNNQNIGQYQFYNFIKNYHERTNRHNERASITKVTNGITAILDGQQRLTSLYIGLKGTYANKLLHRRVDDPTAYPEKKLCLNLISPLVDGQTEYEFKFLTRDQSDASDDNHIWFTVHDVFNFKEHHQINDYIFKIPNLTREQSNIASKILFRFRQIIFDDQLINYFLETDPCLDKVLNIFIRINSGGTKLNYSDLLLSVATAQWQTRNAREEITNFVDQLNSIGNGFDVNKDFILKSCLVLSDMDIRFKVDNFTHENMLKIEGNWVELTKAIEASVNLVSSFGYQKETLTSNFALIPIALFLYTIGSPNEFILHARYANERVKISKWLAMALLKGSFGGHADNVLNPTRNLIKESENGFPLSAIVNRFRAGDKSLAFNDADIDNLFEYKYGQARLFPVLTFIYPTLDFRNKFHQDHIFPKHQFTTTQLTAQGIDSADISFYQENYNCLANLQLLEGVPNQYKSGKGFQEWLNETYLTPEAKRGYMTTHYIPDIDFSIQNFKFFIEQRKKLISEGFRRLINERGLDL